MRRPDKHDICGCETRRETIGEDAFFNGGILLTAAIALLLAKGGKVSTKTRNVLLIAAAGAAIAVISDAVIRPMTVGR